MAISPNLSPSAYPAATQSLTAQTPEQKRAAFMMKRQEQMTNSLSKLAEPPKSKGEAITRSIFSVPQIVKDGIIGLIAWPLLRFAAKRNWMSIQRPGLWAIAFVPIGMGVRGAMAAVTGTVPGQERAQALLQSMKQTPQNQDPLATSGNPANQNSSPAAPSALSPSTPPANDFTQLKTALPYQAQV